MQKKYTENLKKEYFDVSEGMLLYCQCLVSLEWQY